MLFSPKSMLVHRARIIMVTTHCVPIAVSAVQPQTESQWFSSTAEAEQPPKPKKVERGFLFSAPCLDPTVRLAAEETLDTVESVAVESVVSVKPVKIEKGFLFSAPCLEMNRDGQLKDEETEQK
jgi:hypothetical protein